MFQFLLKIQTWCLAFLLLAAAAIQAQQNKVSAADALPKAYVELRSDTARMRFLMNALADSLNSAQLNYVLPWAKMGLAMAEKNNTDTMKGIFYFDIAKAFTYKYNKYDSAIFYYKKVLPYFPDRRRRYNVTSIREIMERYADMGNKDSSFVYMDTLNAFIDTMSATNPKKISLAQNMATVYQYFGMYKTAIQYFQIAITGNREAAHHDMLGMALANLSLLYNEMEDDKKAIQYSKEALQYLAGDNMPYMQTTANIAEFYLNEGQADSARAYLHRSDSLVALTGSSEQEVTNKNLLATIYLLQKKFDAAKKILDENLTALAETDEKWNLCKTYINYTALDTSLHNYSSAKQHLAKVLDIAQKNQFPVFAVMALQHLAEVYAQTGDHKAAYTYQQQYIQMKDSIASERAKADLNDLEVSYKTIQKEQQIELLKKDNDIKGLKLQEYKRSVIFYIIGLAMLLTILGIIFYQRNKRNKIKAEKIKAELQTQILRSQMNPHFIFNCLNSIENFIMQNDKRQASDYLNKFSLLIRSILDSSRNETVPIAKDMEALQLYVELEQLRFNNKFTFHVSIDPALAGGDYLVPSLLVQPFVENAIVHGMAHSEEKQLNLSVTATLDGDKIKYIIQDNGIGREKAKVINMLNKPYHKSVGLKITEERINIFNQQDKQESIHIVDLYDENKNPEGTKVEITLKAI